jgi:hypothetical protein
MQVVLLTPQQKQEIQGKRFAKDSYFNPIQDNNGNWIVSIEEQSQNINPDFDWLSNCPLIEYEPVPPPPFLGE